MLRYDRELNLIIIDTDLVSHTAVRSRARCIQKRWSFPTLRLGPAAWPFLAPRPLPFRPPCFGVLVVGARLRSLLSTNY